MSDATNPQDPNGSNAVGLSAVDHVNHDDPADTTTDSNGTPTAVTAADALAEHAAAKEEQAARKNEWSGFAWAIGIFTIVAGFLFAYIAGMNSPASPGNQFLAQVQEQREHEHHHAELQKQYTPGEAKRLAATVNPGSRFGAVSPYDPTVYGFGSDNASDTMLNLARRNAHDPFAEGALDAPVTLLLFSDFECPYCAQFSNTIEPKLREDFINTGLVRLEWHDFAVVSEASIRGAEAGRAAGAQNKFFDFTREWYRTAARKIKETGKPHPEMTEADAIGVARRAGVPNIQAFTHDLRTRKFADTVAEAMTWASQQPVQGVPTLVGQSGVMIPALSYSEVKAAVERELALVAEGIVVPHAQPSAHGH